MSNHGNADPMRLRLMTYLSPSIPLATFVLVQRYLEEKLSCYVYLLSETRWSGPPRDRIDPFTTGDVDIGFACAPNCHRLVTSSSSNAALLGVAPVYIHPHTNGRPVYFTDVIVHKDNRHRFQTFDSLRGASWSYNDKLSMSGFHSIYKELKRRGENGDFFGKIVHSGSHLKSIEMVLDKLIDCSGNDSNTLALELNSHPELRERIHVVTSIGPMPIYPGLVNSQLPEDLKVSIVRHLLNMHQDPEWGPQLKQYLVDKFVAITMDHFEAEEEENSEISAPSDESC